MRGSPSSLPLVWIPVPFADPDEGSDDDDRPETGDDPGHAGDGGSGDR